jgi:hypothetical protein
MILRVLVASVASLALSGCCKLISLPESDPEPAPDPAPTGTVFRPGGPGLDLGVAVAPPGTPPTSGAVHAWSASRLKPSAYRLEYALAPRESQAIDASLHTYAKGVGYADEGSGKFRWVPPPGCTGDMHCVFESIAAANLSDVSAVADRFRMRRDQAHLSTMDLATLVVTFVQAIDYKIPDWEPFGVLPPALVVSQHRGDCDSKSLLAHMVLHQLGFDTMLISSNSHHHTMLGIAIPVQGTKFTYSGRDYAFTEMTAKGSPIGHINSELLRPNDWKPVPFRYPASAKK